MWTVECAFARVDVVSAADGSIVGRMAAPGSRAGERQYKRTPRHHRRLCTFCTCTLLLARSRHRRRRIKGRPYAHRRLCYCEFQ